ncbi:MAG TPA: hypothetical protein VF189_06505 [Patescibacteria group bacterium]
MSKHSRLIADLLWIAKEAVRKRGRRLSWLTFAKRRAPKGYAFALGKDAPWDVLHEIAQKAAMHNPAYAFSQVVDIASELFNQNEEEMPTFDIAY